MKTVQVNRFIVATMLALIVAASDAANNRIPDLNGTWENGGGIDFVKPITRPDGSICVRDCGGPPPPRFPPERPKYKPEFAAKVKALDDQQVKLDPTLRCKPPGVPRIGPPDKIVQTPKEVIFLYEDITGAHFRVIAMNAKHVADEIEESYFGHSIGKWEGDTLIVDTIGFNDDTWISDDGSFHTPKLHVVERLKRKGEHLEYDVLVEDPDVLAEPWRLRQRILQLSKSELAPSIPCIDQDLSHVVDGTHHDNLR